MHVDYTAEQIALRRRIRAYFETLMTPELRAEMKPMHGGKRMKEIVRKMGSDGWLGVGWPKEYGGQGFTAIEQQIFVDEARRAHAPIPFVTLNTVGPALMEHGSEEHKRRFLPQILAGEVHFAIGYTEPESGTDLASLQTAAVRIGDEYVVNGTKIFTSGGDSADYIWLAVRTDPEAKKHRGISVLIVDTRDEGFSCSPIHTVGGGATQMTYYHDVRVPVSSLVGPENGGWGIITTQLNHERMGLAAFGGIAAEYLSQVTDWAKHTPAAEGGCIADRPWTRMALGEAHARLEAMKVLNWRMAWEVEQAALEPAKASAVKVYSTECVIEVYRLLLEVVGAAGALRAESPGAVLQGALEREARGCQINTFGGGVSEVQREIVAMLGLGMPRAPR